MYNLFTSLGFTAADYQKLLEADPFATGSTAIDQDRFLDTRYSLYYEGLPAGESSRPPIAVALKNDLTDTKTHSAQSSYTYGVSAEIGTGVKDIWKASLKEEHSWTWTASSEDSKAYISSQSATLSMGSPSSGYAGPSLIKVWYDKLYGTFMFAPDPLTTSAVEGAVRLSSGGPAAGQIVDLYENRRVKSRTFTDGYGRYRFPGRPTGGMIVGLRGGARKAVPTTARPQVDLILPATAKPHVVPTQKP